MGIGGLAIIMVLGLFVLRFSSTSTEVKNTTSGIDVVDEEALVGALIAENFSEKDTDGDGLRDWEETLWNTDPEISDTDGDGTNDGDEVDLNRDPRKEGPGDELGEADYPGGTTNIADLDSTERFARDFFAGYVDLRKKGYLSNESIRDYTLNALVENSIINPLTNTYTANNVQAGSSANNALRTYGNQLGTILLTTEAYDMDDAAILFNSLLYNRPDDIEFLRKNAEAYRSIAEQFMSIVVPQTAATLHIRLANSFVSLANTVDAFAAASEDPVRSLGAVSQYTAVLDELVTAVDQVRIYLEKENIVYATEEPGHTFMQIPATQS